MDVDKRTTHRAQWVQPRNIIGLDITGELYSFVTSSTTISTASTIACFAFQEGSKESIFGDTILRRSNRWRVLLPKARTDVSEGDLLINIVDHTGTIVLAQGRIKDLETYRRRQTGVEAILATLEIN